MKLEFCAICGATMHLEDHHYIPTVLGGPDVQENILTLCSFHHGDIHKMKRASNHAQLVREGLKKARAAGRGRSSTALTNKKNADKFKRSILRIIRADEKENKIKHTCKSAAEYLNSINQPAYHGGEWRSGTAHRVLIVNKKN